MMAALSIQDAFVRQILQCFGYKRMTQYDIEMRYDKIYPPSLFSSRWLKKKADQKSPTVSARDALKVLLEGGYIGKEIYQGEDAPYIVYYITQKGLSLSLKKKEKK